MANNHRHFSPKVPLSSRAQVDKIDAGLCSVRGAQEVISVISSRRTVTKLVLGHNRLGDEGCIVLFKFLSSQIGRHYPISEISLNSNAIGNAGLLAMAQYLKDNITIKELFLQGNSFTGDTLVTSIFVNALNSSNLELLSLTTNHTLGDIFIEHFLPSLRARHLRELHLSTIGLTPRSVPYIAAFIRSPHQCRLHTLGCNGNSLGIRGVRSIIRAIERNNYSLLSTELYANQVSGQRPDSLNDSDDSDSNGDSGSLSDSSFEAWKSCQSRLNRLHVRNTLLKRETEQQALQLLRYSRTLLLHTSFDSSTVPSSARCSNSCSCIPSFTETSSKQQSSSNSQVFPFTSLPIELQLYILSFLAPLLSSTQRYRIVRYASSPSTLPRLLPCLPGVSHTSTVCVPDLAFGVGGGSGKVWALTKGIGRGEGCAGGHCLGSKNAVVCNREKERSKWLESVACSVYELEESGASGEGAYP